MLFRSTSLVRWALDLQAPPALEHQCCDRLRPAWIRRDLDQAVQKLGGALISWQWSGLRQCADGYLLIANQICSFRWIPANGSPLQIHSQLNLNLHTGLTVAPGC